VSGKANRAKGQLAHLPEGGIGLIENLALDPGEQTADDSFAKQLAQLCDIYCNDAIEAEPPIPDLSLEEKAIAAMDALVSPEMKDGQGPPITTEVTTGSASDEILHLARERKVDLITIGTYALVLQ